MPKGIENYHEVHRQARILRDIVNTEAWREFEKIIESQIATRQKIVNAPAHDHPSFSGMDAMARFAALENVKGAMIGLRLALDTPRTIIEESEQAARRASKDEEDA